MNPRGVVAHGRGVMGGETAEAWGACGGLGFTPLGASCREKRPLSLQRRWPQVSWCGSVGTGAPSPCDFMGTPGHPASTAPRRLTCPGWLSLAVRRHLGSGDSVSTCRG